MLFRVVLNFFLLGKISKIYRYIERIADQKTDKSITRGRRTVLAICAVSPLPTVQD